MRRYTWPWGTAARGHAWSLQTRTEARGGCRDRGFLLQRPHNRTPAIETLDHRRKPLSVGGVPRHSPPVSMFVSGQDESVLPPFDVSGDPVFFGIVGLDRLRPAIQITPLLSR